MMQQDLIVITETPINVQDALTFVSDPKHGATTTFIGTVRNHNLGKEVGSITYEIFVPLAKVMLQEICKEVHQRWGNSLKIYIAHYQGSLEIGGISIAIAVSAPHRQETFEACRYLIENIKERCPIWKKEHLADGNIEWREGHALHIET